MRVASRSAVLTPASRGIIPSSIAATKIWHNPRNAGKFTLVGSNVSAWDDEITPTTLSQGTAGNQPTYGAALLGTGLPGITFDGSADFIELTTPPALPTGTAGFCLFTVFIAVAGSTRKFVSWGSAGAFVEIGTNAGKLEGGKIGAVITDAGAALSTTVPTLATLRVDGSGNVDLRKNGVSVGTSSSATSVANNRIRYGKDSQSAGGAQFANSPLGDVVITDDTITTTQRDGIEAYLKSIYGIP